MNASLFIEDKGVVDYAPTFAAMQLFTRNRDATTPDALWLCEHPPVFTQGLAGKAEHILSSADLPAIPVVQTDRGGQVTYHGPGQVVAYPLLDLRRKGYFVKEYVYRLEEAIIRTLGEWRITGHRVRGAPGIYVSLENPFAHSRLNMSEADLSMVQKEGVQTTSPIGKIAALGIKVSQRGCYHGLSLNVAMDLTPFSWINPCGYAGLTTVDMASLGVNAQENQVKDSLANALRALL